MLDNTKVTSLHNYEDEEPIINACAVKFEQITLHFSMYTE